MREVQAHAVGAGAARADAEGLAGDEGDPLGLDGRLEQAAGVEPLGQLDPDEEAARRLARAIASDLSLYNEEKIVQGIQNDELFNALSEEIEEGRALYKSRVSPDLYQKNFYDRALVDILIKSKGHIKSKIW